MALSLPTEPPEGFIDLATARDRPDNTSVNIIGVVVDYMPPTLTSNGSTYMLNFRLLDKSLLDGVVKSSEMSRATWLSMLGLRIRFFRGKHLLNTLPPVQPGRGDVVLLRAIRMSTFHGQKMAMSNMYREVQWSVFPGQQIPGPQSPFLLSLEGGKTKLESEAYPPEERDRLSLAEQGYVITLRQHMVDVGAMDVQRQADSPASKPQDVPFSYAKPHATELTKISSPGGTYGRTDEPPPPKRQRQVGHFGPKYKRIADFGSNPNPKTGKEYADLAGEVVKLSIESYGGVDMYITDYTFNKMLKNYPMPGSEGDDDANTGRDGDQYSYITSTYGGDLVKWPGPWGQRVLKINVKQPHCQYAADHVKVGDWVLAKNVKSRTANGVLEGDMWKDDVDKDKIKLEKLRSNHMGLTMMQARRDKYWEGKTPPNHRVSIDKIVDGGPAENSEKVETGQKLSRKQKKKLREKNKKAEQKSAMSRASDALTSDGLSKYIRCSHEDVPISNVPFIRDRENKRHMTRFQSDGEQRDVILPFMNARYRARVRVVDFFPRKLEDFSVLLDAKSRTLDDEDDDDSSYDSLDDRGPRYEWSFALCLEDVRASNRTRNKNLAVKDASQQDWNDDRIWVHLHHEQAVFLFGRDIDDPEDLRQNTKLLSALREKLFLLWGNLEEIHQGADRHILATETNAGTPPADGPSALDEDATEGGREPATQELSNRPFECCIWEYGVPVHPDESTSMGDGFGWKRMFAMAGTTIT